MALTAAERAKRYREKIKNDPERYEAHKKKELARLKKSQKKVKDLTDEEKSERRKKWREQKRQQKEKKKLCQKATLPQTSSHQDRISTTFKVKYRILQKTLKKATENIHVYKTALHNMRKRLYRQEKRHELAITRLKTENDKIQARQELLEISLREAYSSFKRPVDQRILKKVAQKLAEKENLKPDHKLLGLKGQIRINKNSKRRQVNEKIRSEMEAFYNRDDISRSTAGKKETRTLKKKKMQIRYLVDTIRNVYSVYKDEGGRYSYTTFFRYKPFYVLSPNSASRDTCMCIKHSNMDFVFDALKLKRIIPYMDINDLLKAITCNTKSFNCMYNKCNECASICIQYSDSDKLPDQVTWHKWIRVDHRYEKSGREYVTKKTVKQQIKGTVKELIQDFEKQLEHFKPHIYNWKEQQSQYRTCVTNLSKEEMVILCDFSENFDCKYSNEIQSMHFGASKNSITLQTGVIFGKDCCQSFVTISDDNCHEPNAIWAHLLPVIKHARTINPEMKIIHFFSDGPSSQYRQKKNFFLLNLFTLKLKLSYTTWSFSEAGHGKSLADGIGGSVKRQLDRRVNYGEDILNTTDAHQTLQRTMKAVMSFYVSPEDVKNIKKLIPEEIRAVPGTMKLHQIISAKTKNQIEYRELSCFCGEIRGLCKCHSPKTHMLVPDCVKDIFSVEVSKTATNGNVTTKLPCPERLGSSNLSNPKEIEYQSQNQESLSVVFGGSDQIVNTDVMLSLASTKSSELLGAATEEILQTYLESEPNERILNECVTSDQVRLEAALDLPVYSSELTLPFSFEKQSNIDYENNSRKYAPHVERESHNEPPIIQNTDAHQIQYPEFHPSVRRVKVMKPVETYDSHKVSHSIKKAKILTPGDDCTPVEFFRPFKSPEVFSSIKDKKNYPPSKRISVLQCTVLNVNNKLPSKQIKKQNLSSLKTFYCHLCKTRQPFNHQQMVKCLVCKNWLCISCSGTNIIESESYVCSSCLNK